PARYLSFVLSRFVPAQRTTVAFPPLSPAPGSAEPDESRPSEPAGKGSTEAASRKPNVSPPATLDLRIEANPRLTHGTKELATRTADILSFYRSVVGEAPYPSFTIALIENTVPGGH